MKKLTVAICTHNGANRLPLVINALSKESCKIPFEILIIDNNSDDNTENVIAELSRRIDVNIRYVKEVEQGIPFARNRAITEGISSDYLLFIDDDELPAAGLLDAAVMSLEEEDAECVGGKISASLGKERPGWLTDELLPFYGEIDYGDSPFWIKDRKTPVWSGLVAYQTAIFTKYPELRFDARYNRKGKGVGGGSDGILFRELLKKEIKIRYQPLMEVNHIIPAWKMKKSYFLKLHFIAGKKYGQYEANKCERSVAGVPLFVIRQFMNHAGKTIKIYLNHKQTYVRQAMNAAHSLGTIIGMHLAWKHER